MVCAFAKRLRPSDVVVVGDGDEPGREGAEQVASALAVSCSVRVIYPPEGTKDAREWKRRGAIRADVEAAIEASAPVRLVVRVLESRVRP